VAAPVRCAPVRHHGPSHTAAQPTPTSPRWRAVRTFLTAIKVLGFDADMRVEAIDLSEFDDNDMIRAVDIDADSRMRGPLIRKVVRDENYLN
jgi:hypothetical protein